MTDDDIIELTGGRKSPPLETDAEFVEREWCYLTEGQQREARWQRLFTLARRGAAMQEPIETYFARQIEWSRNTFGPGLRTGGIIDHIGKELKEVAADPHDLSEWVDLIILSMDGFWRHGGTAGDLLPRLLAKQRKNMARTWPDWRTVGEDKAIEHDRSAEPPPAGETND